MTELLDSIDRLLDGLCPCGSNPRPGSAYCSYDCEPNHVAVHTDQRETGDYATPMRWRPDLVTAHDDSRLTEIPARPGDRNGYTGQHNPTIYERTPSVWHLRLDDGHRFVGLDVALTHDKPGVFDLDTTARILETWQRLERELTDSRRAEPELSNDPWADVFSAYSAHLARMGARMDEMVFGRAAGPIRAGQAVTYDMVDLTATSSVVQQTDPDRLANAVEQAAPERVRPVVATGRTAEFTGFGEGDGDLLEALVVEQSTAQLRDRAQRLASSRRSGDFISTWDPTNSAMDGARFRQAVMQMYFPVINADPRSLFRGMTIT